MRRTIREKEPPRPSTRLSTLAGDELTTVAKRRQAEPPKLIHLLRGDLDWIVMKCLEKDRTRRYETANGLALDIQRHLNNEPVVARPPSRLMRIWNTALCKGMFTFDWTPRIGRLFSDAGMSKPYRLPQVEEQTVLDELEIPVVGLEDYPRFQSLLRRHHYLQGIKPWGSGSIMWRGGAANGWPCWSFARLPGICAIAIGGFGGRSSATQAFEFGDQ